MSELELLPQGTTRTAVLSSDEVYRYELVHSWPSVPAKPHRCLAFILCNPSTATHEVDDPTSRKCDGFALRRGCDEMRIYNPYAYRATEPLALSWVSDPIGPDNASYLEQCFARAAAPAKHGYECFEIVLGWGNALPKPLRAGAWEKIASLAARYRVELLDFGRTGHGQPRHPLMLGYASALWHCDLSRRSY